MFCWCATSGAIVNAGIGSTIGFSHNSDARLIVWASPDFAATVFAPPLAGVDIQAEAVSSVSKVVLSIPLMSRLMASAAVKMLPDAGVREIGFLVGEVGVDGRGRLYPSDCSFYANQLTIWASGWS